MATATSGKVRAVSRGEAPELLISLLAVDPVRTWKSDGEGEVHKAICERLRSSQERMCAYCEQPVPQGGAIEHIHPKSVDPCADRPSGNCHYDWTNMLLVCGKTEHCDGPKADVDLCDQVLFPDEMDPRVRYFTVNPLDGSLSVARSLSAEEGNRVLAAIKNLALNHANLKAARRDVMRSMQSVLDESGDEQLARHRALCHEGFPTTIDAYLS